MFAVEDAPGKGKGLFARVSIPQGTRIVRYQGQLIDKVESQRRRDQGNVYIFHLDFQRSLDGSQADNLARFINHSCSPNCRIEVQGDAIWVVADRDLEPAEELSFNYGFDASDFRRFPCCCGAAQCCGYMVDRRFWGQLPRVWRRFRLTSGQAWAEVWVESLAYDEPGPWLWEGDPGLVQQLQSQIPSLGSARQLAECLECPSWSDFCPTEVG